MHASTMAVSSLPRVARPRACVPRRGPVVGAIQVNNGCLHPVPLSSIRRLVARPARLQCTVAVTRSGGAGVAAPGAGGKRRWLEPPSAQSSGGSGADVDDLQASLARLADLNSQLSALSSGLLQGDGGASTVPTVSSTASMSAPPPAASELRRLDTRLESMEQQLAALDAQVSQARAAILAAGARARSLASIDGLSGAAPPTTAAAGSDALLSGAALSAAAAAAAVAAAAAASGGRTSGVTPVVEPDMAEFASAPITLAARMLAAAPTERLPRMWASLTYSSAAALAAYLRATGRAALVVETTHSDAAAYAVAPAVAAVVAPPAPAPVQSAAAVPVAPAPIAAAKPAAAPVPPAEWGTPQWAAQLVRGDTADLLRISPPLQITPVPAPPLPPAADHAKASVQVDHSWAARLVTDDTAAAASKRAAQIKAESQWAAIQAAQQAQQAARAAAAAEEEARVAERRLAAAAADKVFRAQMATQVPVEQKKAPPPAAAAATPAATQVAATPPPKKRAAASKKAAAAAEVADAGVRARGDAALVAKLAAADAAAAAEAAATVKADALAVMNAAADEYARGVTAAAKGGKATAKKGAAAAGKGKPKAAAPSPEAKAAAEAAAIAASVLEQAEEEAPQAMLAAAVEQGGAAAMATGASLEGGVVSTQQRTAFKRFTALHGKKKPGQGPKGR